MVDQYTRSRVFNSYHVICWVVLFHVVIIDLRHAAHGAGFYSIAGHTSLLEPGTLFFSYEFDETQNLYGQADLSRARVFPNGHLKLTTADGGGFGDQTFNFYGLGGDPYTGLTQSAIYISEPSTTGELQAFSDDIAIIDSDFELSWALIVTWFEMAESETLSGNTNSYQIVLATDYYTGATYAIFNYVDVDWIGDGGRILGGYKDVDMIDYGLPCLSGGSGLGYYTSFITEGVANSNIGIPGRYVLRESDEIPTLCSGFEPPQVSIETVDSTWTGTSASLTEGEAVVVQCSIDDRDPAVTDISITCGAQTNQTQGTDISLSMDADRSLNGVPCECVAMHETGYYRTSSVMITVVYYPSLNPPRMSIVDVDQNITNGDSVTVFSGTDIVVKCVVEGGNLSSYSITLECGSGSSETSGTEASLDLYMEVEWNGVTCDCRASHATQLYDLTSSFGFVVPYPPSSDPVISINNYEKYISNGHQEAFTAGEHVDVKCEVDGGIPAVSLVKLECGDVTNHTAGTETTLAIDMGSDWHRAVCVCRADHITNEYYSLARFSMYVRYPPTNGLEMTIDNNNNNNQTVTNGSSVDVSIGDDVDVKCVAEGGNPVVNNVMLTCGNGTNDTVGTEHTLTLSMERDWNQVSCQCQADHVTGDLMTFFTFNIPRIVGRMCKYQFWIGVKWSSSSGYSDAAGNAIPSPHPIRWGRRQGNNPCIAMRNGFWFRKPCYQWKYFICAKTPEYITI